MYDLSQGLLGLQQHHHQKDETEKQSLRTQVSTKSCYIMPSEGEAHFLVSNDIQFHHCLFLALPSSSRPVGFPALPLRASYKIT
jgi:hypothetical protein